MDGSEHDVFPEGLRRRKAPEKESEQEEALPDDLIKQKDKEDEVTPTHRLESGSYWLTRILLLRYIGFIYCEWNLSRLS